MQHNSLQRLQLRGFNIYWVLYFLFSTKTIISDHLHLSDKYLIIWRFVRMVFFFGYSGYFCALNQTEIISWVRFIFRLISRCLQRKPGFLRSHDPSCSPVTVSPLVPPGEPLKRLTIFFFSLLGGFLPLPASDCSSARFAFTLSYSQLDLYCSLAAWLIYTPVESRSIWKILDGCFCFCFGLMQQFCSFLCLYS